MKIKKLDLAEDIIPQLDNTDVTTFTNIISALIKDEWEAIDGYNNAILSLSAINREDAIPVLKDIISEEYVHIGQLEKLLQSMIPVSNEIESGAKEAETQISDTVKDDDSKKLSESFIFIKSKQVPDSDGFLTDYSMYKVDDKYVMIFGDSDRYDPSNAEPDWETESKDSADEWFDNYEGFEEDEEWPSDDIPFDIAESVTFKKKDEET